MAITDVTYRFEFGSAITEAGLNAISAGLRLSQPSLFTRSDTVVVKQPPPSQPPSAAHLLTIYAVVKKPLAFNLYPVAGMPTLPADSLIIQADISFSLTDNILGLVTGIEVVVQAAANIQYSGNTASIELLSFDLVDIEADLPSGSTATVSKLPPTDAGQQRNPVAPIAPAMLSQLSSDPLGDSFRAIINYLVELYLKDTLETVIASFPVPSLDQIIGFGGLGTVPIAGIFIRNKAFYLMAGNDLGSPATFPGPSPTSADLRIGVSQAGMRRAIAAFLPMPVPINVGSDSAVLHLTGNLSIPTLDVTLPPGSASIPVKVNIEGLLNLHVSVQIPILGGTLAFDVPIPIDKLTGYTGSLLPTLDVQQYPAKPNAAITIGLAPDVSFLGDWWAFVVTDYRDYLAKAFRNAANNAANQLLGSTFCNIPLLGWIVCGAIDVTAQVVGYLLGAVIDFFASTILTALVNALGRVLFLFFQAPTFNVLTFKQADLFKAAGVSLSSATIGIVDNGRDGDLELSGWIQDQGLPPVPVPGPVTPLPPPQPTPIPPYPGAPTLPEYAASDFAPAFPLSVPAWTDGLQVPYVVTVTSGPHPELNATYAAQFSIQKTTAGWRLSLITHTADGTVKAESRAEYDAQNIAPQTLQRISYGSAAGSVMARQIVDLTQSGKAIGSFGTDGGTTLQLAISTIQNVATEWEDFWPFRLAYGALAASAASKLGTIAMVDPRAATNWVREIPFTLTVAEGVLNWGPAGGPAVAVKVWIVTALEENKQTVSQIAKDGQGLLQQTVSTPESQIVMTKQA